MSSYRICSLCGKRNSLNQAICSCNNILLNCPIFSNEDAQAQLAPATSECAKFRKCPECGHLNRPDFNFCEACSESLADVFDLVNGTDTGTAPQSAAPTLSRFRLVSDGGVSVTLPVGDSIVGRGELMGEDITRTNRMFVSSAHIRIHCSDQELVITDISRNGTFVNSERIPAGEPIALKPGDMIGLGGVSAKLDPYGYYMTVITGTP